MAVKRNYRINLRNYGNPPAVMVSQYDENYDLVFEVYDGVVPATGLNVYTVKLVGRQPGDDPALKYEFTGTVSGIANNILSFTIDTTMTGRAGKGTAEIVILDATNDVKFASFNLPVYVEKAAVPDDAIDADVERAQEIADEVQEIVDTAAAEVKGEAESWAVGQRNGTDVPATDPTYHNNAKYYAEQAQQAADSIGIDTTLSVAGKAADAKKVGDEISAVKENLNAKIDSITDGFDVTSTGKTALYLNVGETAIIDVTELSGTVNVYIDGYSSSDILIIEAVQRFAYTATHSGYLRFYFSPNATMSAHVGLKTELNSAVESLVGQVSSISDATFEYYNVPLELGNYNTSDGTKISNDNRLRTVSKISREIESISFSADYIAVLFAWDNDGTYLGAYTGDGFSTNWHNVISLTSPVNIIASYPYTYVMAFRRIDSGDPSISDLDLSAVSGVAKNIAKELTAIKDIPLEFGTLDTNTGANHASQAALRTPAYIPTNATKVTFSNCKARFFAYTQDGVFVGGYGTDGYTKDWSKYVSFSSPVHLNDLGGENYLFRIVFNQFTGDVITENADAKYTIDVLDELKSNIVEEYTVGTSGDFATFTEMLIALENNTNEKTVYVQGGTYDIFEEMGGAEYMASLTDASNLNWRDVCHVVPLNTTIIGVGDVVLAWNPTDAEIIDQDHAFLFSPLNISGTCKIKNIKIECSNARYGIHDETSGRAVFNGAIHEFENVSVVFSTSTYGIKYAYGAGHSKNMKLKFKNCLFSAPIYAPWSSHDWPATASENSTFEFDNCIFLNTHDVASGNAGTIRFSSADTTGRLDDVKINACVFNSISFSTEGSSDIKQGYKVTTMLCKPYTPTWTSHILETDRIAPVDYLVLD